MTERPILFSAPMVRALLAGTKVQTRRVVKPQPDSRPGVNCTRLTFKDRKGNLRLDEALEAPEPVLYRSLCPYGAPGDRLWVREAWRAERQFDVVPPRDIPKHMLAYEADEPRAGFSAFYGKLRPGMFMPRWASRIILEVTGVRVERLQDISADDAYDEGAAEWAAETQRNGNKWPNIVRAYQGLWESINGAGSWDANPWVWVVEFRRL